MAETTGSSKKLITFHQLHVEIVTQADEELLDHLQNTILGTPGGLLYQHTHIKKKLENIGKVYFMLLKKSGHLLGSVGLVDRQTEAGGEKYKSWYVRYFSIRAPLRSRKFKPEKEKRDASRSVGLLKSVALPYFENPGLLDDSPADNHDPSFLYAYIENANYRSLNFSAEMGLTKCRNFTTLLFSRFRLRGRNEVTRAEPHQYPEIVQKISSFYSGHTMFYPRHIFMDGNYFVYMENGRMTAGLQVHRDAWKIISRSGFAGKLLLKVFPGIPGVKKVFDPAHFRFLAIEGIWYEKGGEKYLEPLLEAVCHNFKTHVAIMWFDTFCPVLKAIEEYVDPGLLGKMIKRTDAEIRVRFYNFSPEKMEEFTSKPAYLSAFDTI